MSLSPAETQQFNRAFADAIASDHPSLKAQAISPADAKKLFCDHYDEVSMVLGALQELISNSFAKLALATVAKAVDALHGTICKAKP